MRRIGSKCCTMLLTIGDPADTGCNFRSSSPGFPVRRCRPGDPRSESLMAPTPKPHCSAGATARSPKPRRRRPARRRRSRTRLLRCSAPRSRGTSARERRCLGTPAGRSPRHRRLGEPVAPRVVRRACPSRPAHPDELSPMEEHSSPRVLHGVRVSPRSRAARQIGHACDRSARRATDRLRARRDRPGERRASARARSSAHEDCRRTRGRGVARLAIDGRAGRGAAGVPPRRSVTVAPGTRVSHCGQK